MTIKNNAINEKSDKRSTSGDLNNARRMWVIPILKYGLNSNFIRLKKALSQAVLEIYGHLGIAIKIWINRHDMKLT